MGKGQMYSWGKKGCHQGFEWSMNTWIFSYMGAKKYERNIKGNIKGIHEYSHMGAKKVPMAEKRTYPGSELTWGLFDTCQLFTSEPAYWGGHQVDFQLNSQKCFLTNPFQYIKSSNI